MSARRGFTLMEVVFAVAIVATALVALQATVAGSIQSAGTSVNRRAAREVCRAKLEEVLAGSESPDGGGDLEDRPGFRWSARSEELTVGMPERGTEVVVVVIVEVTFPAFSEGAGGGAAGGGASSSLSADAGMETISMASVMPHDAGQGQQAGGPR
ncbi:MAG: prepilin-type N-terminal cleavage/methylation domain-containing protein [Planctomycetes bacterium]|nr:prepilin-type N-terminal cleavage/methylation domain-containing protein [Planctomycetota bacterium]